MVLTSALLRTPRRVTFATLAVGIMCGGVLPAQADRISHPTMVFSGLDKITGRIISFDVAINETVQFGTLQLTPRVCYTRPQTEAPQTDGFVEVDDLDVNNKTKRIFTGWMFAASPGLHGVEHPVYDVWLTDCKGEGELIATSPETSPGSNIAADPTGKGTPASAAAAVPFGNGTPSGASGPKAQRPPASASSALPQSGTLPNGTQPAARASNAGGTIRQALPPVGAPIEVGSTPGTPRQTLPPPPPPARNRRDTGFDDGFGGNGGSLVPPGSIPNGRF